MIAAESIMLVPVLAGLAAMLAVAVIGGWLQGRRARPAPMQRLTLQPRAHHDPRRHVHPGRGVYDWARHDCWPSR